MPHRKQTGTRVASIAAKQLEDKNTPAKYKPVDASAVSQAKGKGGKKKK